MCTPVEHYYANGRAGNSTLIPLHNAPNLMSAYNKLYFVTNKNGFEKLILEFLSSTNSRSIFIIKYLARELNFKHN